MDLRAFPKLLRQSSNVGSSRRAERYLMSTGAEEGERGERGGREQTKWCERRRDPACSASGLSKGGRRGMMLAQAGS